MQALELEARDAARMEAIGDRLAARLRVGHLVFFRGELGAGKTTLIRGILRGLGCTEPVKSPTYTLIEPYTVAGLTVFHFDLYRVNDPEELEAIGVRDYVDGDGICLVEWPERGEDMFPLPDVEVMISPKDGGRILRLLSHTESGAKVLAGLQ